MQKQSQPQTTRNSNTRDASVQIRAKGHTPGPWYIGTIYNPEDDYRATCIDAANGDTVAVFGYLPPEEEDTRLIAAAPELLAELEAAEQIILAMLNVMTLEQKRMADEKLTLAGISTGGMTRYHERRAAIEKARGTGTPPKVDELLHSAP